MGALTREAILSANDRRTVTVAVPEWGGEITLAEMTGEARERYETLFSAIQAGKSNGTIRAELVAACAVDPATLAPLFTTREDVDKLAKRAAGALNRVFVKAIELNVLSVEAAEKTAGE